MDLLAQKPRDVRNDQKKVPGGKAELVQAKPGKALGLREVRGPLYGHQLTERSEARSPFLSRATPAALGSRVGFPSTTKRYW